MFVVAAEGQEVFRSGLCRGGEAPVTLQLDLHGAREITLRGLEGGGGFEFDQADWAEAE